MSKQRRTALPRKTSTESSSPSPDPSFRTGKPTTTPPETVMAAKSRLKRWQSVVFVCLFVGYFLYTAGRRGVTAAQDSLGSELGFTMEDIGILNSAFTTAYGGSKFLGNLLTDVFSASQLFTLGLTAAGVANCVLGCTSSKRVAVFVWSLNGGLQGLGWPALSEVVMKWFEPVRRGSVWSTCTVAGNLAKSVSPLGLALVSKHFGWRAALLGPGGAALVAAVVIFTVLRDSPESVGLTLESGTAAAKPKAAKSTAPKGKDPAPSLWSRWRGVLSSFDFWLVNLSNIAVYFVLQGLSDWTPKLLRDVYGLSAETAASGLFWYENGGVLSTFTSGFVSDRLRGNRNLTSLLYTALLGPSILVLWMLRAAPGDAWTLAAISFALFVAGAGANGPKTMCGLEIRERFAAEGASGTAGALLGLMGQVGASCAGWPLTQAHAFWGGWDGVLWLLLSAAAAATVGFAWLLLRGETGIQLRAQAAKKKR